MFSQNFNSKRYALVLLVSLLSNGVLSTNASAAKNTLQDLKATATEWRNSNKAFNREEAAKRLKLTYYDKLDSTKKKDQHLARTDNAKLEIFQKLVEQPNIIENDITNNSFSKFKPSSSSLLTSNQFSAYDYYSSKPQQQALLEKASNTLKPNFNIDDLNSQNENTRHNAKNDLATLEEYIKMVQNTQPKASTSTGTPERASLLEQIRQGFKFKNTKRNDNTQSTDNNNNKNPFIGSTININDIYTEQTNQGQQGNSESEWSEYEDANTESSTDNTTASNQSQEKKDDNGWEKARQQWANNNKQGDKKTETISQSRTSNSAQNEEDINSFFKNNDNFKKRREAIDPEDNDNSSGNTNSNSIPKKINKDNIEKFAHLFASGPAGREKIKQEGDKKTNFTGTGSSSTGGSSQQQHNTSGSNNGTVPPPPPPFNFGNGGSNTNSGGNNQQQHNTSGSSNNTGSGSSNSTPKKLNMTNYGNIANLFSGGQTQREEIKNKADGNTTGGTHNTSGGSASQQQHNTGGSSNNTGSGSTNGGSNSSSSNNGTVPPPPPPPPTFNFSNGGSNTNSGGNNQQQNNTGGSSNNTGGGTSGGSNSSGSNNGTVPPPPPPPTFNFSNGGSNTNSGSSTNSNNGGGNSSKNSTMFEEMKAKFPHLFVHTDNNKNSSNTNSGGNTGSNNNKQQQQQNNTGGSSNNTGGGNNQQQQQSQQQSTNTGGGSSSQQQNQQHNTASGGTTGGSNNTGGSTGSSSTGSSSTGSSSTGSGSTGSGSTGSSSTGSGSTGSSSTGSGSTGSGSTGSSSTGSGSTGSGSTGSSSTGSGSTGSSSTGSGSTGSSSTGAGTSSSSDGNKQQQQEEEDSNSDNGYESIQQVEQDNEAIAVVLDSEPVEEKKEDMDTSAVKEQISEKIALLNESTKQHKPVHMFIHNNRFAVAAGDEEASINRGVWISGLYGINKQGAWKNIPKYQGRTTGVTIGLDADFINSHDIIGIAYSRLESQVKYNKKLGKTAVNGHLFSLYGLKELVKGFSLQAITSYGHNYIKNKTTSINNIIGKYQNNNVSFETLLNYKYRTKHDLHFIPSIGFKYDYSRASNYKEYNIDIENLMIQKKSNQSFESSLGGKIVFKPIATVSNIILTPSLHGNIEHHFNNKNTKVNAKATFKGQTLQQTIILPKQPKFGYNVGSNILITRRNINLLLEYNYYTHKKYQSHQGLVKLKVNF